jgi:hypothetical protein
MVEILNNGPDRDAAGVGLAGASILTLRWRLSGTEMDLLPKAKRIPWPAALARQSFCLSEERDGAS